MGMMIKGEAGCELCSRMFKDKDEVVHILTGRVDFMDESIDYDPYCDTFICKKCWDKIWKEANK